MKRALVFTLVVVLQLFALTLYASEPKKEPTPSPTPSPTPTPNAFESSKPIVVNQEKHKRKPTKKKGLAAFASTVKVDKTKITDAQVAHTPRESSAPDAKPSAKNAIPTYLKEVDVRAEGSYGLTVAITLADEDGNPVISGGSLTVAITKTEYVNGGKRRIKIYHEDIYVSAKDFTLDFLDRPVFKTRRIAYEEFSNRNIRDKCGLVVVGFTPDGGPRLTGEEMHCF